MKKRREKEQVKKEGERARLNKPQVMARARQQILKVGLRVALSPDGQPHTEGGQSRQ